MTRLDIQSFGEAHRGRVCAISGMVMLSRPCFRRDIITIQVNDNEALYSLSRVSHGDEASPTHEAIKEVALLVFSLGSFVENRCSR